MSAEPLIFLGPEAVDKYLISLDNWCLRGLKCYTELMAPSHKTNWHDIGSQRVERDEQGRAHICIQCMKAVKPWGPCYEQGHEVAPIQNLPKFARAN